MPSIMHTICLISLLSVLQFSNAYVKDTYRTLGDDVRDVLLHGDDNTFHFQKVFNALNLMGFCVLPKLTSASLGFVHAYHAQYGFDVEEYNKVCSPEEHLKKIYPRSETLKVPFKTHRVWITDP